MTTTPVTDIEDGAQLLAANAADEVTQTARVAALRGKKVLWVCAPGIPMISESLASRMRWAIDAGVQVVALFSSPEEKLRKVFEEKELMHACVFADLAADDVGARVEAALAEAGIEVDGVHSPYEQGIVVAATIANHLHLASDPARAFVVARDKAATREACRAAGIPTPRSGLAATRAELAALTEHVGFPCIVKPSSGAGSCGVFRANSLTEAEDAFDKIEADLAGDNWALSSLGLDNQVLVEQLLQGPEFDVDVIMHDGEVRFIKTTDNWVCPPPYFLESGSNAPSAFPAADVAALEKYTVDVVRALGFSRGAFHVESIITAEGPRLIECNARVGGGNVQRFQEAIYGVDMFANSFLLSMNIPVNPPCSEPKCAMADFSFVCEKTGVLRDVSFVDVIKKHPAVLDAASYYKPGDHVVGMDTGFPVWLGEMLVCADTPQTATDIVNEIVDAIHFDIVPISATPSVRKTDDEDEPANTHADEELKVDDGPAN